MSTRNAQRLDLNGWLLLLGSFGAQTVFFILANVSRDDFPPLRGWMCTHSSGLCSWGSLSSLLAIPMTILASIWLLRLVRLNLGLKLLLMGLMLCWPIALMEVFIRVWGPMLHPDS